MTRRLTAEMVRAALCAIGLPGITDPSDITFRTPIYRDGPGWRARVELPAGVDAAVVERRSDVAAALGVSVGQVLPTAGPEHARCLDLWVDLDGEARPVTGLEGRERRAEPGEMCACGRPAVLAFETDHGWVPYCGIPDGGANRQHDDTGWEARAGSDAAWLADTSRRMGLRYGRALAALAEVPALLYRLGTRPQPETPEVEEAADRLTVVVQQAIGELDRLDEYAWAITEPPPAYCRTCDADLGMFVGLDGWQHWRLVDDPTLAAPAGIAGQRHEVFDPGHPPQLGYRDRERVPWTDPDLDGPTPTTPRNDARLWARLVDRLGGGVGAERPARRLVAEVRRERGDGRTFAPGDQVPADVAVVYDLDASLWDRQVDDAPPTRWRMRGFDPAEHEPAAGEPHTTAGLLDAYGPVTEVVRLPGEPGSAAVLANPDLAEAPGVTP